MCNDLLVLSTPEQLSIYRLFEHLFLSFALNVPAQLNDVTLP